MPKKLYTLEVPENYAAMSIFLADDGHYYCKSCFQDTFGQQCECRFRHPDSDCIENMDDSKPTFYEEAPTHPFAFTLRKSKNNKNSTVGDYINFMKKIFSKNNIKLIDNTYETENGLHTHGYIEIPKKFNFKKLRIRGWNIKVKEIYDMDGWTRYCYKKQLVGPHDKLNDIANDITDDIANDMPHEDSPVAIFTRQGIQNLFMNV